MRHALAALVLAAASAPLQAGSTPVPVGPEFQVNTYTFTAQGTPAIATDAGGDFVVVWQSLGSSGRDTFASDSLQGQRYSALGAPQGAEFQVNSYTTSVQINAAIAAAAGDFVVVWESFGSSGGDTSGSGIQSQRYSASGAPQGAQFQVNSYTPGQQRFPAIAADADGDFVVVWDGSGSSGGDIDDSVQGRRFRVTGDLQGTVFLDRNSDGIHDASEPGVAGIAIELYDLALELHRTAVTDANGDYVLKPKEGLWNARFVPPASGGFTFTAEDVGGDDEVDSDADPQTGWTNLFQMTIGLFDDTLDAGILPDIFADGFESGGSAAWSATVP